MAAQRGQLTGWAARPCIKGCEKQSLTNRAAQRSRGLVTWCRYSGEGMEVVLPVKWWRNVRVSWSLRIAEGVHCIHEDLLACTQGTFIGQVIVGSGVREEDAGVGVRGGG